MLRRTLLLTLFFVFIFFLKAVGAVVSFDDARAVAQQLVEDVALYSQDHPDAPGAMPEWMEATSRKPILVRSYPNVEPLYYLVPVHDGAGGLISAVGISAKTGKWQWYVRVEGRDALLEVGRAEAVEASKIALHLPLPGKEDGFVIVSMPNKKLYWYLALRDADGGMEIFVDSSDARNVYTDLDKDEAGLTKEAVFDVPEPKANDAEIDTSPQMFDYPSSYDIPVTHHYQINADACGPGALEMMFDYYGPDIDQNDIIKVANCQGGGTGTNSTDLRRTTHFSDNSWDIQTHTLNGWDERDLGYGGVKQWWSWPSAGEDPDYPDRYNDLKQLISMDYPILVLTHYEPGGGGHFRVVKGYNDDLPTPVFIVHDPWYSPPYYGPDVNFEQSFLVDNLWEYIHHWGVLCPPWTVEMICRSEVNINERFPVAVDVKYHGPHPFEGQYAVSSPTITITLPGGFSLVMGETATKSLTGITSSGSSDYVVWWIDAGGANASGTIRIEAKGLMSGTSNSYGNYSDYIGNEDSQSIRITTTYYVSDSGGNDSYNGLYPNWIGGSNGPKKTIQAAINVANGFLDHVKVLAGTYTGAGNKDLNFNNKVISVEAPDGPDSTTIDCQNSGRAFIFSSGESSSSVVDGFTLRNGNVTNGAAVYCSNSSDPTIKNCVITSNEAQAGGAIYCTGSSSPWVRNCTIVDNSADGEMKGGGGVYCTGSSNAVFINCVIADNSAYNMWGCYGGGIYLNSSNARFVNCTIYGNSGFWGGGGVYNLGSDPIFDNCILWGNTPQQIFVSSGAPTVNYCDIEGGWAGAGTNNVNSDPLFVDTAGGNYRVRFGSPCIDAGKYAIFYIPPQDKDGRDRYDEPNTPNTGGGTYPYYDIGAYELYSYFVDDSDGNNSYDGLAPDWDGTHGPKKTIQAGIDAAVSGEKVTAIAGTYTGDGNKLLLYAGKAITVSGESIAEETIIDCGDSGLAFVFVAAEGADSVLENFTIRDGNSNWGGAINCSNGSSPTIRNCIIESCTATGAGGAMYFHGNSTAALMNCTITDNSAPNGGGIYCTNSSPSMTNCTFYSNTASTHGGGLYCSNSSPALTNCLLWDDGPEEVYVASGTPTLDYCDIEGGWTGTGSNNMDEDPALCSDLHLFGWSPCIDAGTASGAPSDDVDGESRPQDSGYDIGSDEFCDSDGDGLCDYSEINTYGTYPDDPDSDDDLMPDGWEVKYAFDPLDDSDAALDVDGDGCTNYEEYVASTDPRDPASFFAVVNIEKVAEPLEVEITWKSVDGKYYAVHYSDDELGVSMSWTLAQDMIPASGTGTNAWTDDGSLTTPGPDEVSYRCYKVEVYED